MIHILALLAKAGHGKTTVAKHLETKYGARVVSLAAPLKRIAKVVMDFSDAQLWGTQEEKEAIDPRYGMSARIFLQKLGTEGIRANMGQEIWCQALLANIVKDHEEDPRRTVYVVDDVRFPNEVTYLRNPPDLYKTPKFFGTVIKLVCTDAPPSGNDNHPSERGIDEVREHLIAKTITSSRAQGTAHLITEAEEAFDCQPLRAVRVALREQRQALGLMRVSVVGEAA